MPSVPVGSKILVSGASGFIALHIVGKLLERGFRVVGTVRSIEKGEYVRQAFRDASAFFEYVIVEDVSQPGCFDQAVKNVDGVIHTASPFHYNAVDPAELTTPAVRGTIGMLESLKKHNPNVRRVVVTSSYASIIDTRISQPHRFTEAHWNDWDILLCEQNGQAASALSKYRASKTLAERAFWKWFENNQPDFDGVSINPPLVLGPLLQHIPTVDHLNTSNKHFWLYMSGQKAQADLPDNSGTNWVNVLDVAEAHVRALEAEEASGQRFLISAGPFSGNDFAVFLNANYPNLQDVPKGVVGIKNKLDSMVNLADGSKASKLLGIRYRTLDETLSSLAKALERFLV